LGVVDEHAELVVGPSFDVDPKGRDTGCGDRDGDTGGEVELPDQSVGGA
jgi:hypothetical protein